MVALERLRNLCAGGVFLAAFFSFAARSAEAYTYYWDTNGTTTGFGTASGTWGTDAWWNTDSTGGGAGTFATYTIAATNVDGDHVDRKSIRLNSSHRT